jgi:hypothetical protein
MLQTRIDPSQDPLHILPAHGANETTKSECPASLRPSPPPSITLRYATGWRHAYAHFSADGGAWTPSPGVRLAASDDGSGELVLTVPASRREFVLNDGGGGDSAAVATADDGGGAGRAARRWDTPDPFAPRGVNYVIDGPGVWRLAGGKLARVE